MLKLKQVKKLLSDLYPKTWNKQLKDTGQDVDVLEFDNLQHFKHYLKQVTLKPGGSANKQDVPFATALDDLVKGKSIMSASSYETIKNEVKSVLHRRGLISENVYEGYQYDTEGEFIDIAEYISGNPACMLKPKVSYKSYFYELFISAAYLGNVTDETIKRNVAKILATVQLLEQEHIYIKITIVAASSDTVYGKKTLLVAIPLFSHKEEKTIESMSAVINERFFRTFIFGIREDMYGDDLYDGYGRTIDLNEAIKLRDVNVETLAQTILDKTVLPGGTR